MSVMNAIATEVYPLKEKLKELVDLNVMEMFNTWIVCAQLTFVDHAACTCFSIY